ncbi:DUF6093 family protein [Streptomyces sp. NPDC057557]|uniref:DUF6093 family protein n=1 Tax=Streptomyces sp. NPDC057557 TaxID=3346167 RepID=UPI0036772D01
MSTPIDIEAERERLEAAVMVDVIRIIRPTGHAVLDEDTGMMGPTPTETIYEGAGAVLSGHGQVTAQHVLGREWLDDTVSWYRLLTPISAPVPSRYDRVEVVTAAGQYAATAGRVWQVLDPSEASTVEIARVTRLDEVTSPN